MYKNMYTTIIPLLILCKYIWKRGIDYDMILARKNNSERDKIACFLLWVNTEEKQMDADFIIGQNEEKL